MSFIVATGIECSAPVIAGGLRRDELRLTGHWDRYEEDFRLVAELGITHLRYGIPFHVVAREAHGLDWSWTDRALAALRDAGLEPIVDLLHFGVPDDLTGIGDPRLPARYLRYVEAFAERYPWVRWYTPVNEPFITAHFSAGTGWWNERTTSPRGFVAALDNVITCAIEGMAAIRERRPDAVFVQSDACESFTAATPAAEDLAALLQERRFLPFDLTYGRAPGPRIRAWLREAGMTEDRFAWFAEHGSDAGCIVGLDYYQGNERLVHADGREEVADRRGFAAVAREFHDRYGLPFMLAETNAPEALATAWLTEVWDDAVSLLEEGRPLVGFCWYSLTDQVDWDTCLREPNDRVNTLGLVDLDRRPRAIHPLYRQLVAAGATGRIERIGGGAVEAA
jgi:beta-glucosidase